MQAKENARPVAAGKRAYECVLDKQSHSNSRKTRQRAKRRNLDAAVIGGDHPDADKHGRHVPDGAQIVMLGAAVAGYFKSNRSKYVLRSCRAHEIERLFLHRHPASEGVLPLPEDEIAFARALVAHATPEEARSQLIRWRVELTPEVERILGDAKAWSRKFKADALGALLRLTENERDRLGITTFRAAGQTAATQAEARRARDRERKRARRAQQSCGTMKSISAEKLRPWEEAGVSRRTWYRHKVAGDGTASVISNIERFGADTFSAKVATLVLGAIAEPKSLDDLVEATGLPRGTIKPILSRLRAAGKAAPVKRGIWRAINTPAAGDLQAAAQIKLDRKENARGMKRPADETRSGKADIEAKRIGRPSSCDAHVRTHAQASVDQAADAIRIAIGRMAVIDVVGLRRRASAPANRIHA